MKANFWPIVSQLSAIVGKAKWLALEVTIKPIIRANNGFGWAVDWQVKWLRMADEIAGKQKWIMP